MIEAMLKSRLEALMKIKANQECCDCSDRKPTWVSLIVPPPGAPPGSPTIGGFCCMNCSGIHRGLGTHICFVRSITLDDWKESEVVSLEMGGNQHINSIFYHGGREKHVLTPTADLATRAKFIREKYVERLYFNPMKYDDVRKAKIDQPKRVDRRRMMPRQMSMPAISAAPIRGRVVKKHAMLDEMKQSDASFATDWATFSPIQILDAARSPTTKNGTTVLCSDRGLTKKETEELSVSWHPQSPAEKAKLGGASYGLTSSRSGTGGPRQSSERRMAHTERISHEKNGNESDGSGSFAGESAPNLCDATVNSSSTKTDLSHSSDNSIELGGQVRTGTRRTIRGRRGGMNRQIEASASNDQSPSATGDSGKAGATAKKSQNRTGGNEELIAKLKDCLAGDDKDNEEKIRDMVRTLQAEVGLVEDKVRRRSASRSLRNLSDHRRRRSTSRKRVLRRHKSDDGELDEVAATSRGETLKRSQSHRRLTTRRASNSTDEENRRRENPQRRSSNSRSRSRESTGRRRRERSPKVASELSSGDKIPKGSSRGNTRSEARGEIRGEAKSPRSGIRKGGESLVSRKARRGTKSEHTDAFGTSLDHHFSSHKQNPNFAGDNLSIDTNMKPNVTTEVVKKQIKSEMWKEDFEEFSDEDLFANEGDPFLDNESEEDVAISASSHRAKESVAIPINIVKDAPVVPCGTTDPSPCSIDLAALTFYN